MFRSVIGAGRFALQSSILVNGGAAVAILAFIGSPWALEAKPTMIPGLADSLGTLAFGVLATVVAAGMTYIGQALYSEERTQTFGHVVTVLTIGLVLASYIAFYLAIANCGQVLRGVGA